MACGGHLRDEKASETRVLPNRESNIDGLGGHATTLNTVVRCVQGRKLCSDIR